MAETKEKVISVTERKKAEELLKVRYKNLERVLRSEVADKRAEMRECWERSNGAAKLRAGIAKRKREIAKLEDELEFTLNLTDDPDADSRHGVTYNNGRRIRKVAGTLRIAFDVLDEAERNAITELMEAKSRAVEQLWFGMLSADALQLLEDVPTLKQLKSNGMSMLKLPASKLLGPVKKRASVAKR